jgi:hypothetical protein
MHCCQIAGGSFAEVNFAEQISANGKWESLKHLCYQQ